MPQGTAWSGCPDREGGCGEKEDVEGDGVEDGEKD